MKTDALKVWNSAQWQESYKNGPNEAQAQRAARVPLSTPIRKLEQRVCYQMFEGKWRFVILAHVRMNDKTARVMIPNNDKRDVSCTFMETRDLLRELRIVGRDDVQQQRFQS